MLTYNEIMQMEAASLAAQMTEEFCVRIPVELETPEELANAGRLLGDLTNKYVYMVGILAMLKAVTRNLSRKDEEYSEMMSKRDTVDSIVTILKQQYSALSRMITVKQEVNREIAMTKAL